MIAYYYIDKKKAEETAECGLKLSVHGEPLLADKEHPIRAIRALLSPKDDMDKYNDHGLACMKLDIPNEKLLVAEEKYLELEKWNWFNESVVHAENYMLGSYRKPCFLITFTVLGEYIGILDKSRDVPVLYDRSGELYVHKVKSEFEYADADFYDRALYGYLKVLEEIGNAKIVQDTDQVTVFSTGGKKYIIGNPKNE
jgi:hypothetical protein